ncbi:MAG TPA: TetR/AcrR family transcriptional regulator C-terminal domain-containing protein [Stellaceae bacterium]|nr:TetR/AcrR family transcriptional regulator C-terminal domain-containing protein [Stellaceae bacterium]
MRSTAEPLPKPRRDGRRQKPRAWKRRSPREISASLARVAAELAAGRPVAEACRAASVSIPSYYRWRERNHPAAPAAAAADPTREAILKAARTVFLRDGFRVSLAAIAKAAGVARQTVYNQFGSKEQLFSDVVQAAYLRLTAPVLVMRTGAGFIATLREFGRHFMNLALDPENLALLRITLGEFREFPDLARLTYALRAAHAVPVLTDHIAHYLQAQMAAGVIEPADPLLAAEAFCGSFASHARHLALIGMGRETPERMEARLDFSVAVFARGLGYRGDT